MLNGSNFESAYLKRTDFTNVNLSGALMTKVRMENCRFESSNLAGASFIDAELTDCTFSQDCDFNGTSFKGADLDGVDFNGADLTNANLSGCSTIGLKGTMPQLPLDCRIEPRHDRSSGHSTGVAIDTLATGHVLPSRSTKAATAMASARRAIDCIANEHLAHEKRATHGCPFSWLAFPSRTP